MDATAYVKYINQINSQQKIILSLCWIKRNMMKELLLHLLLLSIWIVHFMDKIYI